MSWWSSLLTGASKQPVLRTARLRLVRMTAEMLAAELGDRGALPALVGARVTDEWPPEHWDAHLLGTMLQQMRDDPGAPGWHRYVLLCDAKRGERVLVGALGAFPRDGGDVEIAYSTLPEFQRRGLGTEAVRAFVDDLLMRDGVASVSAQSRVGTPESMKVMERCGMSMVGTGDEDATVRYRRMR